MANPTFHLGTVGPALYALQAGSAVVVAWQWSAERFAELVDRHGADTAFVSAHQLVDLVVSQQAPQHQMRRLFHGGSKTADDTKRAAIARFGPVLHEYYGTSTGVVSEATSEEWWQRPGTVGRPLPGVRVQIQRFGRAVGPETTGRIHVRYRKADHPGSYVDTGDVGHLDGDGYLFVHGRAGTGDDAAATTAFQHAVRSLPGVTETEVLVVPGAPPSVTCFVEFRDRAPDELRVEVERIGRMSGLPPVTVVAKVHGSLPRTASGKVWRARLPETVVRGGGPG
jgi:long-chain acyl-CoA synthetase